MAGDFKKIYSSTPSKSIPGWEKKNTSQEIWMGTKEVKCFTQKKNGVLERNVKKREKRQVLKMIPNHTDIQMKVFITDNPKIHPLGDFLKFQFLRSKVAFMYPGSLKPQTLNRHYYYYF